MDIRKLSYVLAFVLAASFGAFACGEDEKEPNEGEQCEAPLVACGDACVNTKTDDKHCGECDNACGDGETCDEGVCKTTATGCTTDEDCGENETCNTETGVCEPVEGPECESDEDCGENETCNLDTNTCEPVAAGCESDEDCGENETCNLDTNTCEPAETECDEGLELCAEECVDLQTSNEHCGECDNACEEGSTCTEGACVADEEPGDDEE